MELRNEVARYAKKMYTSRLVRATQGNLSARDVASGLICITPSGTDYETLSAEDIVVVDETGQVVEGRWQPSIETPLHTLILQQRRDIHCVMHTHSPYATISGVLYEPIAMVLAESALCLGGEVPIAPYQRSGSREFAELVAKTLGHHMAVIWGNHGAMVVGPDLPRTFSIAHALEDSAQIYFLARLLGTPHLLPPEEVEQLHRFWLAEYRQKPIEQHA
ncbi:class II aldolase/adducin family protein [Thermogemmatispora sp.]|uniref:class II aldolase/adducin family protein n=1 Tax=Thermogemmatispora sp. TaxID=1968838 RepID=UPI002604B89A|nr:class II aldolase/adducin family protein [Thermogemmatispora sp.]